MGKPVTIWVVMLNDDCVAVFSTQKKAAKYADKKNRHHNRPMLWWREAGPFILNEGDRKE